MADQVSTPIEESDAIQEFVHACDEADLEEAERLARSRKIPRGHIRHGLKMFLTTHETYDGLDTLFAKSRPAGW